ncbi:NAD(P)/FAD-dependent oxidoreductase [Acuticoccus mangrovi]|uniref:FAD-binding oxidoreductase n=1 Tax=Acuticoccus mangrovi TaxID=2796142 RepID=A0A934MEM5_9HYPH|nr:FAD-binding oxidoreductase [Acuticoccus mangrovi]MBJ3774055.1 FAD-binding oxidoreductase [Acuticoccus mangrovi]
MADIFAESFTEEPLWWNMAKPEPTTPDALPDRCDVLVVGAGYAGLGAALTLAEAGTSVAVVDAEMPGYGGSTRNGGHLTGAWSMIDPSAKDQGALRARVATSMDAFNHTRDLIARLGMKGVYEPVGKFLAAFAPSHYETLARKAEWAVREGFLDAEAVPRERQEEEVGTKFYHGGVRFEPGGLVQPARYHAGVLAAALAAGAKVASPVRVTAITPTASGYEVTTSAGKVECAEVVITTNGYTGAATPDLQRRVVPVASYIIATEVLPEDVAAALIPKRRAVSDSAKVLSYYRLSPNRRRMVYGGRASFRFTTPREAAVGLHAMMSRRFPQLADVKVTHAWTGNVAFARDWLPHMGSKDGIHYALCCNGGGVAMMSYLGHLVAKKILERPSAPLGAFDGTVFPTIPFYNGNPWFVPLVGETYRLRDRIARGSD